MNWVSAQPATNLMRLGGELPDLKSTYKGFKLVSSSKALGGAQFQEKPKTAQKKSGLMRSLTKSGKFSSNLKIFPQNLAENSSNLMNICLIQCFPAKFSLHFSWDGLLEFQRGNPQLISRSNQIRWRQLGTVKLGGLGESRSGMDTLRVNTFFF